MKTILHQIFLFTTCILLSQFSYSQTVKEIEYKTIPNEVVYKDNVEAPLTDKEFSMIKEVYNDKADEMVFNNPTYLKDLKNLLRNRIKIYSVDDVSKQKKCVLLSEVGLNNKYNSNIKVDAQFNKDEFNPLKYNLDFFENGTYLYRVDNTNYFIQVTSQYRK